MTSSNAHLPTVGFIGLGTMGRHMARNLLRAGFPLVCYARRAEVLREFKAGGAASADSPAAVARAADVVITIVTADAQVREVTLGPNGVLEGAATGKLLVDMSTIGPHTIRDVAQALAARGMKTLDAPVSGGPWGAEAGTLSIMVGGDAEDLERVRPIFQAMGKHIFHLGPLGAGQTVKIVNQLMAGGIMALVAEGLVLGKKAGLNPQAMADVIAVSSGNSEMFAARVGKFILADQYEPGFMTDLMRKDVALALELAHKVSAQLPVGQAALEQYDRARGLGLGDRDFAAVVRVCEQAAGVKVAAPTV